MTIASMPTMVDTSGKRRDAYPPQRRNDPTAFQRRNPSAPDRTDDRVLQTTERRLWRLVGAAIETGASFGRGDLTEDPVEWFARPLMLFGGQCAFEACQERTHLERLVLLHGLAIGSDVNPHALDALCGRDDPPLDRQASPSRIARLGTELRVVGNETNIEPLQLWTARAHIQEEVGYLQVFWAMIDHRPTEVRARIRRAYGLGDARRFRVTPGFDWSEPLANALVSEAVAHTLELAAADPGSEFAAGLDIRIEQRFRN